MDCPACGGLLVAERHGFDGWIEVDACRKCRGLWLEPGELDGLDDSLAPDAESIPWTPIEDEEARLQCPRCRRESYRMIEGAALERVVPPGGGPALRRCPLCSGLWLTANELEAVRDFVLKLSSAGPGSRLWCRVFRRRA